MEWLTEDLRNQVRKVFEARYRKALTNEEVDEIARNLVGYMEAASNFIGKTKLKALPE